MAGMRARKWGAILNISSKGAIHPAGPPFGSGPGTTVYGMVKAALERFTTGLAAEVHRDNVRVNVLSPTSLVPTPGAVHHNLLTPERARIAESVDVMAAAALALVTDPRALTGRIAYSQQLLWELGLGPKPLEELLVGEHPRAGGALMEE
jgi:citronellol/citronellal dehydrogenase